MKTEPRGFEATHAAVLLAVLAAHGAALYGLSTLRTASPPPATAPVFVTMLPAPPRAAAAPSPPQAPPRARPPQAPRRDVQPAPQPPAAAPQADRPASPLAARAPETSPAEPVSLPASPGPAAGMPGPDAPPTSPPGAGDGTVTLTADLAVACPLRPRPPYPSISRRLAESGRVVVRVELDAGGRVSTAQVASSSGHRRLDEAALAAVRTWRCQPALRNGQPVRAVAMQPFDFILEER